MPIPRAVHRWRLYGVGRLELHVDRLEDGERLNGSIRMSYRNALEAAQARIAMLETEIEQLRSRSDPVAEVAALRAAWDRIAADIAALRGEVLRLASRAAAVDAMPVPSPPTLYAHNRACGDVRRRYDDPAGITCPECAHLGEAVEMLRMRHGTPFGTHSCCPRCGFFGLWRAR